MPDPEMPGEQPTSGTEPDPQAMGEEPEEESGAGYGNHAPDLEEEPSEPDSDMR